MMQAIATGAPLWVWPLLAGLIFIGVRAMRERLAPVWLIYALPLLGLLSLRAVAALAPGAAVWAVFAAAYGLGALLGLRLGRRWLIGRAGARVRLAGEALTLVQVLVIFAANFVTGTLRAVAPALLEGQAYPLGFALVAGGVAGVFAGRALAVALSPARG